MRIPKWVRYAAGILISLACLVFIAFQVNLGEVLAALEHFRWPFMLAAVASLTFGYAMRIVRWSVMLRNAGATVTAWECAAPFLGSIAMNNVLPLRLGDVTRALIFPGAIGVTRVTATGSLVLERLIDLATLIICLMLGISFSTGITVPQWVNEAALVLAAAGIGGLLFLLVAAPWLSRKFQWLSENIGKPGGLLRKLLGTGALLLVSVAAMSRPVVILRLLVLSAFVWVGEVGVFYFVLQGFGGAASLASATIVMAIATIATLVPSSPGYVGPFHAAAFTAVAMLGGRPEVAASFALLVHLALWLPTTVVGGIAILTKPALFTGAPRQPAAGPLDAR